MTEQKRKAVTRVMPKGRVTRKVAKGAHGFRPTIKSAKDADRIVTTVEPLPKERKRSEKDEIAKAAKALIADLRSTRESLPNDI